MGVFDIVEIGRQGLNANREALQTTSNNIANANTPGYSRQRPVMHANENALVGGMHLGGVHIQEVIRVHDGFVQSQLLEENKLYGSAKARSMTMMRLEDLIHGEPFRLGEKVTKFFNDYRELSANPETSVLKTTVAESAREVAEGFRTASRSMQGLRADIDGQIEAHVAQVNGLTHELAELNGQVANLSARKETPLELADRREEILRELSKKLGFQVAMDDQDQVNVVGPGGLGVLVNGTEAYEVSVERTAERGDKAAGSFDVFVKEGSRTRQVTTGLTEGVIGGLIHVRDEVISHAMQHLDDAAFQFASTVNSVHREGVGSDGMGERDLFRMSSSKSAAEMIDLSDAIKATAEAVAVGTTPHAPGDNRIALRIAEIQGAKIFSDNPNHPADKPKTINESLDGLVGKIAVKTQFENQNFEHQEAVMNQLDNYRKSISGVNLEEEAINMMQYQTVFNASAKAMKLGDELMQTILSIKS